MKKFYSYILFYTLSITSVYAQVGINYTPFKDEVAKSPFIIQRVDNNALRYLPDFSKNTADGDVIISDANGNAKYGKLTATKIDFVNAVFSGGLNLNDVVNQRRVYNTGASITLPPGRWAVNFSLKFEILKDKIENQVLVENLVYTTNDRVRREDFYDKKNITVKTSRNSNFTTRYNPTTDTQVREYNCTTTRFTGVTSCYYEFTRRTETTVSSFTDNWGPIDRDESIWARVILSDNSNNADDYNSNSTPDRAIPNLYLASGALVGVAQYTTVKGEIYIDNKQTTPKTYYLKTYLQLVNLKSTAVAKYKLVNFAAGPMTNSIDRFFAIPAND